MTRQTKIDIFSELLRSLNLPVPVPEYIFHEKRRWRMDYAWPNQKVALEVEGGIWTNGRHTRGKGFLNDMEKYNTATVMGWRILRTTPNNLLTAETAKMLKQILTNQ